MGQAPPSDATRCARSTATSRGAREPTTTGSTSARPPPRRCRCSPGGSTIRAIGGRRTCSTRPSSSPMWRTSISSPRRPEAERRADRDPARPEHQAAAEHEPPGDSLRGRIAPSRTTTSPPATSRRRRRCHGVSLQRARDRRVHLRARDPDFRARIQDWGGGFIVGGENYGQGSSREHAALAPPSSA